MTMMTMEMMMMMMMMMVEMMMTMMEMMETMMMTMMTTMTDTGVEREREWEWGKKEEDFRTVNHFSLCFKKLLVVFMHNSSLMKKIISCLTKKTIEFSAH